MPFDANLVLADTTLDWTQTNIDAGGIPTDTTRNDQGFAVIDLLPLSGTSAKGMAVIFVAAVTANDSGDRLTLFIEASDDMDFSTNKETLCSFAVDGANGSGVLDGDETPCTIVRRIQTMKRYIRANAAVAASDDFHTCQVLLAPWPFHTI